MTNRYYKKKEWIHVIEGSSNESIIHTPEVSIGQIEQINGSRSLLFLLPTTLESLPYDQLQWTKTVDGKRTQPAYRTLKLENQNFKLVKCTEANNEALSKEVLHYKDNVFVHYFLSDGGTFSVPSSSEVKKERLRAIVSADIRENILPHRTSSSAYGIVQAKGYNVSRKQLLNLKRSVSDTVTGRSGRRVVTNINDIKSIESMSPGKLSYYVGEDKKQVLNNNHTRSDQKNELVFSYVEVFEDALQVYTAGCPTKAEFNDWLKFVEELDFKTIIEKKNEINNVLKAHTDGLVFSSRVFVDTTFNLSDCYVTMILGETKNFRSTRSLKPRVIPLGYLLHSHKDIDHHQFFADKISNSINPLLIDKCVPSVLMDGETSLVSYSDCLSSTVIRCDWHIIRLLSLKFGKKASKNACFFLYGFKTSDGTWKSGLLGSFNEVQFMRRLRRIKDKIDPRIYNWLRDNTTMLIESATATPKLRAGLILQYATSNPSENFNKLLKNVIRKPLPASVLIEKLNKFCSDKLQELQKAALFDSELVVLGKDVSSFSENMKQEYFRSIGLSSPILLSWDPPRSLMKDLNFTVCNSEETNSLSVNVLSVSGETLVLEDLNTGLNQANRVTLVTRVGNVLECSICRKTLPQYICRHIICALSSFSESNRRIEIWRLDDLIRGNRIAQVPARSGKKQSDRLGSRTSSGNHVRAINSVSTMTILEETESDVDNGGTSSVFEDISRNNITFDNLGQSGDSNETGGSQVSGTGSHVPITDSYPNLGSLDSTFSPPLTSTRLETSFNSSRRVRRSTRRYSPSLDSSSTTFSKD